MGVLLALRGFIAFIPAFVWKWLAIAAIGFGLFTYGDLRGRRIEKAVCAEAARQAQVAADAQDDQADKEVTDQNTEVAAKLIEQKKVDDETIKGLEAKLAQRKSADVCLYDKSNADPDEQSPSGGVRLPSSRPRADDKKPARPAGLPATGSRPKGSRWSFPIRRSGAAKAGDR